MLPVATNAFRRLIASLIAPGLSARGFFQRQWTNQGSKRVFIGRLQCQTIVAAAVLMAVCAVARADCFEHHGARFGLDPALLRAIALVESGGRPHAVNSSHQARTGSIDVGLMQINTAWLPKLARHGIQAEDLRDPCTSIEIGAWILSDLVQRLGNTWEAVGAYNAACSELKGAACTRARTTYAWKVFRHLNALASAKPSAKPTLAPPAAPSGLHSLAAAVDTSTATQEKTP